MHSAHSVCPIAPTISLSSLAPDLYWVKQFCPEKAVDHHAILDVGNRTGTARGADPRRPAIIHQTPPSVARESASDTGRWTIVQKISDEVGAVARLRRACTNPFYRVLDNNCEHFARYIATGVRESHQLQMVSFVAAIVGLAWVTAQ